MYITSITYFRVEKYLEPELKKYFNIDNAIITNDMKCYIKVDNSWLKQARQQVRYNGMFDMLKGLDLKIRSYRKIK